MTEAEAKSDPQVGKDKHKKFTIQKILYILTGVVIVLLFLPPTISTALRQWPKLCCRYADINIKTGQARYARYLGFVKLSEEVRDTSISLALECKTIDVADVEPWHRVYTVSPLVRSPCYRYIGVLGQTRQIELIDELIELNLEEKRLIAENVLNLWQTDRRYGEVNEYLSRVLNERMNLSEKE